jgi:hypothetical protein
MMPPCVPPAAHVIVVRGQAAVFATRTEYEACEGARPPIVLGGRLPTPGIFERASTFRLAGHMVGFAVNVIGSNGSPARVEVRSLRTGRTFSHAVGPRPGPVGFADDVVTSLVVDRLGASAWIVTRTGRGISRRKVAAASPRGRARTLDAGGGIAARSLRLHGRTLSWLHDGRRRRGRL